jgi:hypothetical protein
MGARGGLRICGVSCNGEGLLRGRSGATERAAYVSRRRVSDRSSRSHASPRRRGTPPCWWRRRRPHPMPPALESSHQTPPNDPRDPRLTRLRALQVDLRTELDIPMTPRRIVDEHLNPPVTDVPTLSRTIKNDAWQVGTDRKEKPEGAYCAVHKNRRQPARDRTVRGRARGGAAARPSRKGTRGGPRPCRMPCARARAFPANEAARENV